VTVVIENEAGETEPAFQVPEYEEVVVPETVEPEEEEESDEADE
jgi:hypothetical protein